MSEKERASSGRPINTSKKWYEKTWVIILFLLIFWPVGLFLMWRFADWSKTAKVVVTIIIAGSVILWMMLILLGGILFMLDSSADVEPLAESREERSQPDPQEGSEEQEASAPDSTLLFDRMKDIKLHFDDRNWKLGYQDKQGSNIIMEYVLEGETVYTRSEMVTVNFLGTMAGATPQQFAALMEEGLREDTDGDLEFNIFNERNNELMYEFILKNDSQEADQHEVARVVAVNDGIFVLHYMIEEAPMSPEHRQKWIDLLSKAEVY